MADDEAAAGGAEEDAGVAELGGVAVAAGGGGFRAFGEHVVDGFAGFCGGCGGVGSEAVGEEGAGEQVVDGDVVAGDLAGEAADEAGEAGAGAVAHAEGGDWGLHGAGCDVDDAAEAAGGHAVDDGFDEEDGGQHVGVQRADPVVAVPVAEVSGGGAAGVVDEDVGVWAGGEGGGAACFGGDVAGDGGDGDAGGGADFGGCGLEGGLGSGGDDDVDAFAGEGHRAGSAEALAGGADDCLLALQSGVHRFIPSSLLGGRFAMLRAWGRGGGWRRRRRRGP